MEFKNMKCYGCHKKGHIISNCPEKKRETSRMIQTTTTGANNDSLMTSDPWIRILSAADKDEEDTDQGVPLVGPVYNVNIEV